MGLGICASAIFWKHSQVWETVDWLAEVLLALAFSGTVIGLPYFSFCSYVRSYFKVELKALRFSSAWWDKWQFWAFQCGTENQRPFSHGASLRDLGQAASLAGPQFYKRRG